MKVILDHSHEQLCSWINFRLSSVHVREIFEQQAIFVNNRSNNSSWFACENVSQSTKPQLENNF